VKKAGRLSKKASNIHGDHGKTLKPAKHFYRCYVPKLGDRTEKGVVIKKTTRAAIQRKPRGKKRNNKVSWNQKRNDG